ncbi:MAG: sterol desaturase family protein [Legionellaceae bacterium]|nr:sterol desaturase family protein [Legionellaceae bacterium]MBP9775449.1 sterol desaturase family protein [Legionellaceae bacterium]
MGIKDWNRINTKFNYYFGFFLLVFVLVGVFVYINTHYTIDIPIIVAFFASFLFYGAVIEYCFHKFLFHGKAKNIAQMHLIHHEEPKAYLATPSWVMFVLICCLFIIFISLLGPKLGCASVGGICFGYLWYSIIHHLIHYSDSKSKFITYFVAHHHLHHQYQALHYRVSQPFWDHIFTSKKTWAKYENKLNKL